MKLAVQWKICLVVLLTLLSSLSNGQTPPAPSGERDAAVSLEQQGRAADAEAAWRDILRSRPGDAEAYAHLGFLESRQEHYSQAVLFYRKASALNPSMPGLQLNFGLALFKAGELRAAIGAFAPLLKIEPPASPDAQRLRILMGMAHYGLGEYAAAIPYLKEAMARDSQNLPYRLVLAHSCLRSKEYQCVLAVYHEIVGLNAESAEADMLAGEALDEMRDHAGATEQFRAAAKADPAAPDVHFGLGYLLWCQNQYEEAAGQFQAELKNTPNHLQALVYLADSDMRLNRTDAARQLMSRAIQIDPRLEMAHLDLGMMDVDAGQKDQGLREFKVAARLNPGDVQVHWRLARLYQAMGNKTAADAEFEQTKILTKAAEETVQSKLRSAQSQANPAGSPVGAH